ncbi:MAG: AIPR family protein [Bacilli bacterium]|nr:AIPR family protein [Bacilli bacterium]
MDIDQYRTDFIQQIRINAQTNGLTPDEEFVQTIVEKLNEMGELTDPFIQYFGQRGPKNSMMKIDGYSIDPSDKSLIFFQSDFRNNDDEETLIKTDLENRYKQMSAFLVACASGTLANYCDDSNEYVKVARDIQRRLAIKYVNEGEDESIEKFKLIVFTNASLSSKVKSLPDEEFLGRKVERDIWSLERFYEIDSLGVEREPVEILASDFGVPGIPCIKAEMSEGLDYDAYLAIVTGKFLSDIYYKYGSRLLEGNVRAFLSNKGKINQGIRRTILEEPTKFFTYNNGIACTAESITIKKTEQGAVIASMRDFQIINGGQTTASLTSAFLKDKSQLENIFVPMKLTVIRSDEQYDEMVQKISRYANSQNRVTDADFFSNHPFHVEFEKLSKRIVAPAARGSITQTMWYYERSRGKYNQEMFKMKDSEKVAFQTKYPKNQVIKKEELGKYYNTIAVKPYVVTKGAVKNMADFAKTVDDIWQNRRQEINDSFFKKQVCGAIMFKETDRMVADAPWYQTGGFKSQVIPYTIGKVLSSIPNGYSLDWDKIWHDQTMYPSLTREVEIISKIANDFIQDSHGALVSEYVKRESTWEAFKNLSYQPQPEFLKSLVSDKLIKERENAAAKDEKIGLDLNVETEIFKLGGPYWRKLMQEGQERQILGPMDISLLKIACSIDTARPMVPTPKQAKDIWKIRDRLGKNGVLI